MGRIALFVWLALSSGCILQNLSPKERLRDAVVEFNDDLRWARVDLAVRQVKGPFRHAFVEMHEDWGHAIQIGDTEILDMQVNDDDSDYATSVVVFQWYGGDMLVRTTKVRQDWTRVDGEYTLSKLKVVDGDERLFREIEDAPAKKKTKGKPGKKAVPQAATKS